MASVTSVHAPSPVSYEKAAREETKLRRRIERAVAGGKNRQAKYMTTMYLQSYSAKLTATRQANHDLSRHRRVKPKLLPEIAAGLDPWRGTDEVVVVSAKEKERWSSPRHEVRYSPQGSPDPGAGGARTLGSVSPETVHVPRW